MKRALFIAAAIIVMIIFSGDFRVAFSAAKGGKKSTQAAAATSQKTAIPAGYIKANWKEVRLSIGGPNQGLSQYSVPIGGSIVTPHLGSTMSLANFNYVVHVKDAYVHPLQPDNAAITIDIDLSGERIFSGMVFQSYPHINPFQKKDSSLIFYFVAGDPSIQISGNANNFIADRDGKIYLLYKNTLYYKLNDAGDAWDRIAQDVASIAIDPDNKEIFYRTSGSVVQKSMNGGKEWISITNGLPGHQIMDVVINPHNNQEVYALSQGGLYKTVDAGFSWSKASFNEWPHQFLIHPHDKNIFYVRSFNRLFISKDAGLTWGRIDGTLPKRDVKGKDGAIKKESIGVKALAFIDFEKPFLIALTSDKGILKTEDNGVTWTSYNDGFNAEDGAYSIYSNASNIYIGGYGCVFHLDSITQKWSKFQIPSSLSVKTIIGIHALNKEQGIVVAEKDGKIFQINKDNKVIGLNYGILSHSKILSTLSTTIDGAQRTYAAVINNYFTDISNRSLFFTADHGLTWEMSLSWDEACSNMYWEDDVRFVVSPHNPKEMWIFPNCGDNYFVTNDGGKDWRKQSGLESNHLYDFVFDPVNKNVKYVCAGVNGSTLFLNKSTPDGTPGKWTSLNADARRVAVNVIDSKKLLTDKLNLSIDGGWTWQNLKENAKSVVSAESYRPLYFNGEEMLVFANNRILSSTDSGKSWKIILKKDRAIVVTFINPNDTKNIIVGYEDNERKVVRFIQSTDRGETWKPFAIYTLSKTDPNIYVSLSSAVESGSRVLYVGTKDGLFKTRDDGATWQLLGGISGANRANDVRISAPAVVATEQIKIDKTTTVKNVQGEVEAREITISKERLCAAPRNASDSICRLKNHKLNLSKISVDMKINISESGDVTGVEVEKVRGGDFVLRVDTYQNQISQAAKDAAAKYKFIPFEKDDVRVKAEGHITLPVPFTINNMTRDDWETQCAKSKSVGNDREAVDCYSKAIDADPDFWQAYANRANSLLKIKEYQAALSDVDKVILINPSYGNAYNSKGAIYYYMKDYEKAVENFTRSIEMNPKSAMQYANRAASYSNLKKNDLALKDLDSAVDIDSDYAFTYYVRSCVFAEQGKIDKACDSLKKGVKKGLVVTDELKNDKSWDNLRNEECYKKIVNR